MAPPRLPFDDAIDLAAMWRRRSAKWRRYPPDVLPAWVAEMDLPRADPIAAALRAAVDAGEFGYVDPLTADLGAAFAGFAARQFGWTVDPDQVTHGPDVNSGVGELLRLVTGPGEGVVVPTPAYPPFFSRIADIGRRVVRVPMERDEGLGWRLDLDGVERAFAAGTRAFLLCNPQNPTGRVFSRPELGELADLAARYGVTVVSDEVHAPLTLPGARHVPWLSLGEQAAERGVALVSASKAYDIAGLKCALTVTAHPAMKAVVDQLPEDLPYRASILGAIAAEAAFSRCDDWLEAARVHLDGTRRLLGDVLAELLPTVRYLPPEASYLAWLDCRALGLGDDPAATFLERGRVAVMAGPDFGSEGRGFVRLNIGTSSALVTEAVRRMAASVS